MINHERVSKESSWDYSGGCQSCNEHEQDINRFTLSREHSNMGWAFRVCDSCLEQMHEFAGSQRN